MQKKITLYVIGLSLLGGCTLDEIHQYGKTCPPSGESGELSYIQDPACTRESCNLGNYKINFEINTCPSDVPECAQDSDGAYYCSKIKCEPDEHIYKGQCEPDSNSNCGQHDYACAEVAGWDGGSCQGGRCVASACKDGYTLNDGKCEALLECAPGEHLNKGVCEADDLDNCGKSGYACAVEVKGWLSGTCVDGKCEAAECNEEEGYILSGKSCIPRTECDVNQHYYKGICEDDDIYNCGSHGNVCMNVVSGWRNGDCLDGQCYATECDEGNGYLAFDGACIARLGCDRGEHLFKGICEPDDLYNCGSHGKVCEKSNIGWISGVCEDVNSFVECYDDSQCASGFCLENECFSTECVATECEDIYEVKNGKCTPRTSCEEGKHIYQNICEEDSTENCGDHNIQCSTVIAGWEAGSCVNRQCVPDMCKIGYHLDNGICVQDTPSACGEPPVECQSGQLCSNGACKDDCDTGQIRCVSPESVVSCADPLTNNQYCGADSTCSSYISCEEGQTCVNGSCIQTSCPEGGKTLCVIKDQPQCIDVKASDPLNCGSCNYVCADHQQANAHSNTCLSGTCQYECEANYTNCGTEAVPACILTANFTTDSNNCGGCGIQCAKADEFCKAGKCVKSECSNSCLSDGQCINTDTLCGTSCQNCSTANNAASGTCNAGSCKISSCTIGYHLKDNTCELNTAVACAPVNSDAVVNCTTYNNATNGHCTVDGKCVADDCKANFHLNNGSCVADTVDACGKNAVNCTTLAGWSQGKCDGGVCKASQCKSGYCLNGTTCVDGSTSSSTCGTNGSACKSCANHYSCQSGTCKLSSCEPTVCFYQSSACSNTNEHCGKECTNCNTAGNASAGTCNQNSGKCTITACKAGYHLYNGACEPDSVTNCGSHGYSCAETVAGWSSGACSGAKCVASSCATAYHLNGTTCQIDSVENCGSVGKKCSTSVAGWADGLCVNAKCYANACTSGYHAYNGTCESDSVTHCGAHNYTCSSKVAGWSTGQCTNGACVATTCLSAYHVYNKGCEQNSTSNCGSHGYVCAEQIANWSAGTCTGGSCNVSACTSGNHVYQGTCEPDSVNNCGMHDKKCSNTTGWGNGSCTNGTCIPSSCANNYYLNNNACSLSDLNNCGAKNYACASKMPGWANGTCTNNTCKATSCQAGYYLSNGTCSSSDVLNCGSQGYSCSAHIEGWANGNCTNNTCVVTSCQSGYHLKNNTCHTDSVTDCGPSCKNCQTSVTGWGGGVCSNGTCVATSCTGNYHLYNGGCEIDDVLNCGAHGYACSAHVNGWSGGSCSNKTCVATSCQSGYHLKNGTCHQNTVSDCGPNCTNCQTAVPGWNGGSCNNGQCVPASCTSNYHLYNGSCEPDSNTNCGTHGNACPSGESCQNKVCRCVNGFMSVAYNNSTVSAACIATLDDFIQFRTYINAGQVWPNNNTGKYYILTRNINLGNQGNWIGVGTNAYPFTGTFFGNNKTISGTLSCSANYCGPFSYAGTPQASATFKDLTTAVNVSSTGSYVGGLCGSLNYGTLSGVTGHGTISGSSNVGGLVGATAYSTFTSCQTSSTVSGTSGIGGMIGSSGPANITNCSSSGSVSGSTNAGGFAGSLAGSATVNSSYSTGGVYCSTNCGGGFVGNTGGLTLTNVYATGNVSGGSSSAGGLVGCAAGVTTRQSYALGNISAQGICGGLYGTASGSSITSSYYNGTVSCGGIGGGLVGTANGGVTISKSGAFGRVSSYNSAGLVGSIGNNASSININNNYTLVTLAGGTNSGLIGGTISGNANDITCNWIGAAFSNQPYTAAVSAASGFKQNGPLFVNKTLYDLAQNKSYVGGQITINGSTLMMSGGTLVNVMNSACSSGSWESRSCAISSGIGNGTYTMPIPSGIVPSNCH